MRVGLTDSGRQVRVAPGDAIEVRLDANPTTGYLWQIQDAAGAVVEELAFVAGAGGVGGGGEQVFLVRATASGTLAWILRRPWEKDAHKRFELRVRVG